MGEVCSVAMGGHVGRVLGCATTGSSTQQLDPKSAKGYSIDLIIQNVADDYTMSWRMNT